MSEKLIISALKKGSSFLVATHVNPDGDALGCQLAVASALKQMRKKVFLYSNDKPPAMYNFLPGIKAIKVLGPGPFPKFETAIIIDSPTIERIGSVSGLAKGKPKIFIDHHPGPQCAGAMYLRNLQAASCAEIIYGLLLGLDIKIDKKIATLLYTGIATDTGFFRHPNTTADSLLVAGRLIRAGAEAHKISKKINQSHTYDSLQLLSLALRKLKLYKKGKIAVMRISLEMFKKTGTLPEDSEEFVNFPMSIGSVKTAVLLKEISRQEIKVSLRSDKDVNVNLIASFFGGGGHKQASGCILAGTLKNAEHRIVSEIKRALAA